MNSNGYRKILIINRPPPPPHQPAVFVSFASKNIFEKINFFSVQFGPKKMKSNFHGM